MSAGFAKVVTFSTSGMRRNLGVSKGPITVIIKQGDEHEEDSQEEKLTEMGGITSPLKISISNTPGVLWQW